MTEISRRTLIASVGAGAGLVALSGGITWWATQQNQSPTSSALGVQPQRIESANGTLTVDLVAAYANVSIGDKTARLKTYNGTLPGPTLVASPGDVITVNFTNKLGETTNLHMHGFHVSPNGTSDNVFIEVADGQTFTYSYTLDKNHPIGPFWYHPHHHGMAADQLFAGLYGAVIVRDAQPIDSVTEREFVLSDITISSDGSPAAPGMMAKMMGREGQTLLVNGQAVTDDSTPSYSGRTSSRERWRIFNASASRYMQLALAGASGNILGIDSGRYATARPLTSVTLAPGNRVDLLVDLTDKPSQLTYTSVAHPDSMGMMENARTYTNYPLVTVQPSGQALMGLANLPTQNPGPDLRKLRAAAKRTFTLAMPTMGAGMMHDMSGGFTINGAAFDHHTVNTTSQLGTVEEWKIVNTSSMAHPFHLHVWPMQIVNVGGDTLADVHYQDVVNVPANAETTVRVHFDNFAGTAVYHCHILDHEDQGMMGIIEVK